MNVSVAIICNMYYVSNSELVLLENGHLQIHSNDCYNFSLDRLILSSNGRSPADTQVKKYGTVSAGLHRGATGTWKCYSSRKYSGCFPTISDRFLAESAGNWPESTGKKSRNFPGQNTTFTSRNFRSFPTAPGALVTFFLKVFLGLGNWNLRPG